MLRSSVIITLALTLCLASCGNGEAKRITEPAPQPSVTLADIQGLVSSDETREGEPVEADPAAININPFKSSFSYVERDAYDELVEQARARVDYLDRSLALVDESLPEIASGLTPEAYREAVRCAAGLDASARKGVMPAYFAQDLAELYLFERLWPYSGNYALDAYDPAADRDEWPSPRNPGLKDISAEYKKRTYINYYLMRDEMMETLTAEALRQDLSACFEAPGLQLITPSQQASLERYLAQE